ncbi:hypothetical protein [Ensifer canadensis]
MAIFAIDRRDPDPATIRSSVLLPHPDGPTSAMNSPGFRLEG